MRFKLTLLLVIAFSMEVLPQNISQSAVADVNLIVPLSMSAMEGSLDFGEIILTGSSFTQNISPSSGQRFLISGQPNRAITIIYNQIQLSNAGTPPDLLERIGTLTFSPDIVNNSGVSISNGDTVILVDQGNVGEYELWVGGSIFISSNQPHGDYTGTFTITVTY